MPSMPGEFPNRASIEAQQLERLRALLGRILPGNGFYARRLAGFATLRNSLDEFRARVPFTTKHEIVADQRQNPPFGTNLTFEVERYTRYHQTSGTSGAPLRWLDDPESWSWMVGNWKRIFQAAGVAGADRVYFAFSFGPFIGFWLAFEAASQLGCLCMPSGGLSSVARLQQIIDCGATVLCCTPTYARRLAEVADQERFDLKHANIRLLMVAGEPGGSVPHVRARLSEAWNGARIFDHHGMTEVGPVTFECPNRPGVLHVMEEAYFPEIIEPKSGDPVPRGETGELVLTPLGRVGQPVLRYRTGDLVTASKNEVCACGRSDLALEGGIVSRIDDMVVIRGVNVYPSAVDELVRSVGHVAEYRVYVDTTGALAELRLQVEPDMTVSDPRQLAGDLERVFNRAFSMRVPIECLAPGTLPRFELKARRWVWKPDREANPPGR